MPLGGITRAGGSRFFPGIPIAGVPVGCPEYVDQYLHCKANQTMSKIELVTIKLRDLHAQSLYCVTHYCLAPMFQYWTQHNYPDEVARHATAVDQAILASISMCIGQVVLHDEIALQRLRLPARKFGGGI